MPSRARTALNISSLRFPSAQIESSPGGSEGSPHGSSTPRAARNVRTPS